MSASASGVSRTGPDGHRTPGRSMRGARAIMPIIAYAMTAPTCHEPLGYGGGVSITYVGCPGSGEKRYRSGSAFQAARTASSNEGSQAFSLSVGSPMDGRREERSG